MIYEFPFVAICCGKSPLFAFNSPMSPPQILLELLISQGYLNGLDDSTSPFRDIVLSQSVSLATNTTLSIPSRIASDRFHTARVKSTERASFKIL